MLHDAPPYYASVYAGLSAAGMAPFALGAGTEGSILQPSDHARKALLDQTDYRNDFDVKVSP